MGYEEFLGVEQLKLEQRNQLVLFQKWAEESNWISFHDNHYDWWAFPIEKPSGKGFRYSVSDQIRVELKADTVFVEQLRECSRLLLLSWGWDIEAQRLVANPDVGQSWANWPVRLYKCNRSLKLFGQTDMVNSTQAYARHLIAQGMSLDYSGNDLTADILSDGI
jgi:hypothetical protein